MENRKIMKESMSSKLLEIIIEEPKDINKKLKMKKRRNTKSFNNIKFGWKTEQLFKRNKNLFLVKNKNINQINNDFQTRNYKRSLSDFNIKNNKININIKDNKNLLIIGKENDNKIKNIIKRPKSQSLINFTYNNKEENDKTNLITNNFDNLYITSTPLLLSKNSKERYKNIETKKNEINKLKQNLKRNRTFLIKKKKIKLIDEIIKEKEIKFDNQYKSKKSFINNLNKFYKSHNLYTRNKKEDECNNKYNYIKSDFNKSTKSSEKRIKINYSKLKGYLLFNNEFKKDFKNINNLKNDIKAMRYNKYISTNNLIVLKEYKKYLKLKTNDNYLFSENGKMRDFFKSQEMDTFAFSDFANKISKLEGTVAYKYKSFLIKKVVGYKPQLNNNI